MKSRAGAMACVVALALVAAGAARSDDGYRNVEEAIARLARQDGGVEDAGGLLGPAGRERLERALEERARGGGKAWVLVAPRGVDFKRALADAFGRLAPGDRDVVVVAGHDGAFARVPALRGDTSKIDEAFQASRRELAADLADGIAGMLRRLDEAAAEKQRNVQRVGIAIGGIAILFVFTMLVRWARFRVKERGWERADERAHAELVGKCQQRLERVGAGPAFDGLFAELKGLMAQEPRDARAGLERLLTRIDDAGEAGERR